MGYALVIVDQTGLRQGEGEFGFVLLGMIDLRNRMDDLGMLEHQGDNPEWPCYDDVKAGLITKEEYDRLAEHLRTWTPDEPTGILYRKLCGNEGWHVTPKEIEAALDAYYTETAFEPLDLDREEARFWDSWIRFLRRAAKHGGFHTW